MAEALNYANLKKLSDRDLERVMLSPHTSARLMDVAKFVYRSRILNPVAAEACVGGVTVTVDCGFMENVEVPELAVAAELLEAM